MDSAVEGVLGAIYENAGQTCSAGSRLVIERRIHAAFLERLVARTRALSLGHGLRNPQVGPLNSAAHLAKVAGYVRSEEHTSELQSLMRISYAVFCLKKKKNTQTAT